MKEEGGRARIECHECMCGDGRAAVVVVCGEVRAWRAQLTSHQCAPPKLECSSAGTYSAAPPRCKPIESAPIPADPLSTVDPVGMYLLQVVGRSATCINRSQQILLQGHSSPIMCTWVWSLGARLNSSQAYTRGQRCFIVHVIFR